MKALFGACFAPALVAFSIVCAAPSQSVAATLEIVLNRLPDGGVTHYQITPFVFIDIGHTATIVAPDGTMFGFGGPPLVIQVKDLTETQLTSRFAGMWTINDTLGTTPGSPVQTFQFNLTSSKLTSGYPAFPTMFTPADGAVVPKTFDVTSSSSGLHATGANLDDDTTYLGNNHYQMSLSFPAGQLSRNLELRATDDNSVSGGTATPVTPNPPHGFSISLDLNSWSQPHNVTAIVPEPSSIFVALAAFIAPLPAVRRARWRAARRRQFAHGRS